MEKFVDFMAGTYGRLLRVVIGIGLVYVAFATTHGIAKGALLLLAILLIVSGALGYCALNLLLHRSISHRP